MTWSPSPARSSPWSTNTQTSWSPIARCSSAATTDESTPPESPSSTLSPPTCSRTRAIASATMLPGSQRASQSQISRTKRSSIARALQRVRDLRVELHAVDSGAPRRPSRRAARWAMRRPARSPAAVLRRGRRGSSRRRARRGPARHRDRADPSSSRHGAVHGDLRIAEFAVTGRRRRGRRAAAPSSACRSRCRAPARRASNTACGARGGSASVTDSGPPDRMMPRGANARTSASLMSQGWISQ